MSDEPIHFTVTPEPEPLPPMKPGDHVTWMDDDGVVALVVTGVEPWVDEDGTLGERVTFGPAPREANRG